MSSIQQYYVFAFYFFVLLKFVCPDVLADAQADVVLTQSLSLSLLNAVAMNCI